MSRGRIRDEGGGDNGTWIAQKALLKEFFDIFAGKKGYNPETSGGNFLSGNRRRILFVTSSIWCSVRIGRGDASWIALLRAHICAGYSRTSCMNNEWGRPSFLQRGYHGRGMATVAETGGSAEAGGGHVLGSCEASRPPEEWR